MYFDPHQSTPSRSGQLQDYLDQQSGAPQPSAPTSTLGQPIPLPPRSNTTIKKPRSRNLFFDLLIAAVILLIAGGVVFLVKPSFLFGAAQPTSPETVMHNYLQAMEKQQYEEAFIYFAPWNPVQTAGSFSKSVKDYDQAMGKLHSHVITKVTTSGTKATAFVEVVRMNGNGITPTKKATISLIFIENEWKIDPNQKNTFDIL